MTAAKKFKARRRGRPRKYGQGRINATVRFTPDRYQNLKAAADTHRRSISEEVEARITQLAEMLKVFNDERGMLTLLREQNDDAIESAMHERKWEVVLDPRYGGKIFFRPGQIPMPHSHWVNLEEEARQMEAKAEAERVERQKLEEEKQQKFEETIERAVMRALAKARLTINGEGHDR